MADRRRQEEEDYVIAFKSGNKLAAEQLLPRVSQPAAITTTFKFTRYRLLALVSLLHLAAYWGWRNVVTVLVSVYKCAANRKDDRRHIPLHYAAYNGHLEVVHKSRSVVMTFLMGMVQNLDSGLMDWTVDWTMDWTMDRK